jgi:hypothetical protein
VRLPSGIWVNLEGEVIQQEYPIGFEVRFSNLTEENRKLVLQVVAAHGGRQAQKLLQEEEKNIPAQIQKGSRRILIAEDEAMTLAMLTAIIEAQGCRLSRL